MRRRGQLRINMLFVLEALSLMAFLGLATAALWEDSRDDGLVPLDAEALATGPSQERWTGIFFQDQHVGFAVSRVSPTAEGGQLFEQRSSFRSSRSSPHAPRTTCPLRSPASWDGGTPSRRSPSS